MLDPTGLPSREPSGLPQTNGMEEVQRTQVRCPGPSIKRLSSRMCPKPPLKSAKISGGTTVGRKDWDVDETSDGDENVRLPSSATPSFADAGDPLGDDDAGPLICETRQSRVRW